MKDVKTIETELRNSLPALAELINKELGFSPTLHIEMKSKLYPPVLNNDQVRFILTSDSLLNELGDTLVKTIFKEIKIEFWGGNISNDGNNIWFNPKLTYDHPSGGSNGTDFVWEAIWYNIETDNWITSRKICM